MIAILREATERPVLRAAGCVCSDGSTDVRPSALVGSAMSVVSGLSQSQLENRHAGNSNKYKEDEDEKLVSTLETADAKDASLNACSPPESDQTTACSAVTATGILETTDSNIVSEGQCNVPEGDKATCPAPVSRDEFTTKEGLLRSVYKKFLDVVDPFESGMIDELRAVDAMSSGEEEEMKAEPKRRDKARRAWDLMNRVTEKDLTEKFLPFLEKRYPHMLQPGVKYHFEGQSDLGRKCLRHVIMSRLTAQRFADIFPPANCCSLQECRQLLENKVLGEEQWTPVFNLLKRNSGNPDLRKAALEMLTRKGIDQLDDFDQQFQDGFLCSCITAATFKNPLPPKPKARLKKSSATVVRKGDDSDSSATGYPNSESEKHATGSDRGTTEWSERNETAAPSEEDEFVISLTGDQKQKFTATLLKVDAALVKVSGVRTEFRKLEAVNSQLNILLGAGAEASGVNIPELSSDDVSKMNKLEAMLRKSSEKISKLLQCAETLLRETEGPEIGLSFKLPGNCYARLLKRRFLLENEMKEAGAFCKTSQAIVRRMQERFTEAHSGDTKRCQV
ncbi:hypothetical protein BaRGS_00013730 [Batillaria attramentaria]|uniref:Uncharacterized protein n=1 Tax=Batillaria attramentaria TaxID=370345 RepID=A0ABD0L762_9CAEN